MAYYNNYMNQGGGYYGQPMPMQQPVQPMSTMPMQTMSRQEYQNNGLQGKIVDNIEVVKAMEIPLNGSVSYFAIADGSAIVTKQLMMDGTSKTVIYKPSTEQEEDYKPEYLTIEDFNKKIEEVTSFKDEIKTMKRQIEDLTEDVKDINKDIKKRKDW